MANSILKNKIIILRCANWVLQILYENLLILIKEKAITNQSIVQLVNDLNQEDYGWGFIHLDIADYIGNEQQDVILFADLCESAIQKAYNDEIFTSLIMETLFVGFRQKILK